MFKKMDSTDNDWYDWIGRFYSKHSYSFTEHDHIYCDDLKQKKLTMFPTLDWQHKKSSQRYVNGSWEELWMELIVL